MILVRDYKKKVSSSCCSVFLTLQLSVLFLDILLDEETFRQTSVSDISVFGQLGPSSLSFLSVISFQVVESVQTAEYKDSGPVLGTLNISGVA